VQIVVYAVTAAFSVFLLVCLWRITRDVAAARTVAKKVQAGIWGDEVIAWSARAFGMPEERFRQLVFGKKGSGEDEGNA